MNIKAISASVFLIILMCLPLPAFQVDVKVIDKDINIPLEGVKIEVNKEKEYSTDPTGNAKINLNKQRNLILFSLIGYEEKELVIKNQITNLKVEMTIKEVILGSELVVEEKYYDKEHKIGTSFVLNEEDIKVMAMKGNMEDLVASAKLLPGISYAAGFVTDLSVRGGFGDEITSILDGFLVRYPFYWGQSTSIYNPNIVESAKFNNGIFNVKQGMALSGNMEVYLKTPNEGFKIYYKMASSSMELYTQIPGKSKKSGVLLGARFTYLDLILGPIWEEMDMYVPRVPYIYDGNFKWFYKPNDGVEYNINGFLGTDGIGMGAKLERDNGIDVTTDVFTENYHGIGFFGLKFNPNEKLNAHFIAGYECYIATDHGGSIENGTRAYSPEFITQYGATNGLTNGQTFNVDLRNTWKDSYQQHSLQTRLDTDIELNKYNMLSTGIGLIYDNIDTYNEYIYYSTHSKRMETDRNDFDEYNQFNTFLYTMLTSHLADEKLEIETGIRLDHHVSKIKDKSINTYPSINPRFYIAYTQPLESKALNKLKISIGTGLYSKIPNYLYSNNENDEIPDRAIKQEQCWTSVLGAEFYFPHELRYQIEVYYKRYFNRFYANDFTDPVDYEKYYKIHSDGIGNAAGFDMMFKRKISRIIDGWISYSFIYSKFKNPSNDGKEDYEDLTPRGKWYYPYFHRVHGMNIIMNIKPSNSFTISLVTGVHSGLPMKEFSGQAVPYEYKDPNNGEIIELYERTKVYSENRTGISIPLNIRLDYHKFFRKSKVKIEIYVSMDNIVSLFYKPKSEKYIDKYTGQDTDRDYAAYEVFIPGFGIKISF